MRIALIVLLTLGGGLGALSVFVGSDQLLALLSRRAPTFDWFESTRWAGAHSSRAKVTATGAAMVLAAVVWLAIGLFVVVTALAGIGLGLRQLAR